MLWTTEKIKAQAPDENTARRGRGLAFPYRWLELESNGTFVWGKYKTGGDYPYKVAVHLGEALHKCTCPVRQKPCKHNIALLYLSLSHPDSFRISYDLPDWVENWYKRKQKQDKAQAPKSAAEIEKASARKTATRQKRIKTIQAGARDLEMWLQDIIKQGVASLEDQKNKAGFWSDIATRMVDNKMSGIGRRIRELQYYMAASSDWPELMVKELGSLHLIAKSLQNLENLPLDYQRLLLEMTGLATKKEELLAQEGVQDIWTTVGQVEGINVDNAPYRKTWFFGNRSNRMAYMMEYDYQGMGFQETFSLGERFQAVLSFYPAPFPLRAIIKEKQALTDIAVSSKEVNAIATVLENYAEASSLNPWLDAYPVLLHGMKPIQTEEGIALVDEDQSQMFLYPSNDATWKILALSGGYSINVFGEWDGKRLFPLSMTAEGRFIRL